MTLPYIIKGKEYHRVAKDSDMNLMEAVLYGLRVKGFDALLFSDKVEGVTIYRVVVCKEN
ncbi:MAG: hypothetical protein PHG79_13265 [Methanosarcina sp.]|nr:hypothetical protein [Methanosarcina sp.]